MIPIINLQSGTVDHQPFARERARNRGFITRRFIGRRSRVESALGINESFKCDARSLSKLTFMAATQSALRKMPTVRRASSVNCLSSSRTESMFFCVSLLPIPTPTTIQSWFYFDSPLPACLFLFDANRIVGIGSRKILANHRITKRAILATEFWCYR